MKSLLRISAHGQTVKQTYTQTAQQILAALKRIETATPHARSTEQEATIQLLGARLEHIELNQQETIILLREQNESIRTNSQAVVRLMQWKEDHVKGTHPALTKQFDTLGSKVNRMGVLDGAVTFIGVIVAGVVAWFQGNK